MCVYVCETKQKRRQSQVKSKRQHLKSDPHNSIEVNDSSSLIRFIWNFHQNIRTHTYTSSPLFTPFCKCLCHLLFNRLFPFHIFTHNFTFFPFRPTQSCCYIFFLFTFLENFEREFLRNSPKYEIINMLIKGLVLCVYVPLLLCESLVYIQSEREREQKLFLVHR